MVLGAGALDGSMWSFETMTLRCRTWRMELVSAEDSTLKLSDFGLAVHLPPGRTHTIAYYGTSK